MCGNYKIHTRSHKTEDRLLERMNWLNVYRFTLFMRQAWVFLHPPPMSAAPDHGHHGTDHPSNVPVLWSVPGDWWNISAPLGVLDYSLALHASNASGEIRYLGENNFKLW